MEEQELRNIKRELERLIKRIDNILSDEKRLPLAEMTPNQKIDFFINGVCAFWEMSRHDLFRQSNAMARRRHYTATLMKNYTPLTLAEIASALHYSNHSNISSAVSALRDKLSDEPWSDSRMKAVYRSLVEYLELPEKPLYRQ